MTQEDPLATIACVLGILPFIWDLKTAHPGVTHPWYADDARAGGTFDGVHKHLDNLMVRDPLWGYLPDQTNRILVTSFQNVPRAEALFCGYGLKIVTGSRYLGGLMETESEQAWWLE